MKNFSYAMSGLWEITKNESSFKFQLVALVCAPVVAWVLPVETFYKVILSLSIFIPLMAELINSAIERVVDLVTIEYVEMAKYAKDAGAALVFVSVVFTGLIWIFTLLIAFKKV